MDLLSDVLRDLRLESAVLSIGEFRAPWGMEKSPISAAPFHMVVVGHCLFQLEDAQPVKLDPGDLVILPHGSRHRLMSDHDTRCTPFKNVLQANGIEGTWRAGMRVQQLGQIRFGGEGALTSIINGIFAFPDRRRNPLIEALPAVLHVHGSMGRGPAWLENALHLLIDEATSARPGFQTVAERVADVIFIQAVRDYMARGPENAGWLRALADPQISRVLSLVHAEPGRPWTVASLATAAGLSRTVFAERFRDLVGSTVMEYVTARRMHFAAGRLSETNQTLSEIAREVGYESEISFNKAFRRWADVPPGRYRRSMKASLNLQ